MSERSEQINAGLHEAERTDVPHIYRAPTLKMLKKNECMMDAEQLARIAAVNSILRRKVLRAAQVTSRKNN